MQPHESIPCGCQRRWRTQGGAGRTMTGEGSREERSGLPETKSQAPEPSHRGPKRAQLWNQADLGSESGFFCHEVPGKAPAV